VANICRTCLHAISKKKGLSKENAKWFICYCNPPAVNLSIGEDYLKSVRPEVNADDQACSQYKPAAINEHLRDR